MEEPKMTEIEEVEEKSFSINDDPEIQKYQKEMEESLYGSSATPETDEDNDLGFEATTVNEPEVEVTPNTQYLDFLNSAEDEISDNDVVKLENGDYNPQLEAESKPLINDYTYSEDYRKRVTGGDLFQKSEFFANDGEGIGDTLGDYGAAVQQGIWDAGEEVGMSVAQIADGVTNFFDEDRGNKEAFAQWMEKQEVQLPGDQEANMARLDTAGKQFTKTASQFMTGFLPFAKATKLLSISAKIPAGMSSTVAKLTGGGVAGVATDFTVFNEADKRVSDMAVDMGAEIEAKDYLNDPNATTFQKLQAKMSGVLTSEFMKNLRYDEKTDSALMGRTKQAIEGMILGTVLMPIMGALKLYGKSKIKAKELKGNVQVGPDGKVLRDANGQPLKKTQEQIDIEQVEAKQKGFKDEAPLVLDKQEVRLTPKLQKQVGKAITAGDLQSAKVLLGDSIDSSLNDVLDRDGILNVIDQVDELVQNTIDGASKSWARAAEKAGPVYSKVDPKDATKRTVALQDEALDSTGKLKEGYQKELKSFADQTKDLNIGEFKNSVIDQAVAKKWEKASNAFLNNEISQDVFDQITGTAYAVRETAGGSTSNVARSLQQRQLFTRGDQVNLKKLFKGVETQGYNSSRELALMVAQVAKQGDSKATAQLLNDMTKANWKDAMVETFMNSVLSTTSLGVNITSNMLMLMSRTAEVYGAAFKNKKVMDANGVMQNTGVSARQAWGHSTAYIGALMDAFKVMGKSYYRDVPLFSGGVEQNLSRNSGRKSVINEFAPNPAITAKKLGYQDKSTMPAMLAQGPQQPLTTAQKIANKTIEVYGKVLRGQPGGVRSMMATDEFFKLLHYRAELRRYAIESAEQHGLNPVKNPKAYTNHVNDIVRKAENSKHGQKYAGISRDAMDDSHRATFTEKFSEDGEKLYKAIRSFPMISFVLPFVRQPLNNLKWYARRTPGLNMISSKMTAELQAGGARADLAQTQLQLGAAIWVGAITYAMNVDDIRGSSKKAPAAGKEDIELGIDKYTQKDEDGNYITYRGAEPFAPQFASAATMIQQWMKTINESGDQISDRELGDHSYDMMMQGALVVLDTFKDGSAVRGPEQLMKLVDGAQNGNFDQAAGHMAAGILSIFGGNVKYLNEKYFGHDVRYETDTFGSKMKNRYGKGDVPKLNLFGKPMPRARPINVGEILTGNEEMDFTNPLDYLNILPSNIRKTKNNFTTTAEKEVVRLKEQLPGEAVLGSIPKDVEGIKIDGKERHNLMTFMREFKDDDGNNLDQGLEAVMKEPEYTETDDKGKSHRLKEYYKARMTVAKLILMADAYQVQKNLPRTLAEGLELQDYDRTYTLSEAAMKKKGRGINRILGKNHEDYMNLDEIVAEYEGELESELTEFEQLFN